MNQLTAGFKELSTRRKGLSPAVRSDLGELTTETLLQRDHFVMTSYNLAAILGL